MLAILSEIDCLKVIQAKGVYPDEFYTSIDTFRNNTPVFRDATIIVIFAGNCRFNKKHTIELIKILTKRAEDPNDGGISHVYVISDMTIAGLRSYYKYEGTINTVSIMHGWNSVKDDVDIWIKLRNEPKEATCYFSTFDSGVVDGLVADYRNKYTKEDDYIKLIQIPNVKKLLQTS
jgi:hypothetical protein